MAPSRHGNFFGGRHQRGRENRQDDQTENTSPQRRRSGISSGGPIGKRMNANTKGATIENSQARVVGEAQLIFR